MANRPHQYSAPLVRGRYRAREDAVPYGRVSAWRVFTFYFWGFALYLPCMIQLTDSAAQHLLELLEEKGVSPEEQGLRLYVEKGGCAGWSYAMKVAAPEPGDAVYAHGQAKVIVDAESLKYLQGCRLDYVDALNDAGFKIDNPNAARSCGCGTSFELAGSPAASAPGDAEPDSCGEPR